MDKILERIETAMASVTDPVLRRRMIVYRLRTLGYTIHSAAEEMNISVGTAHSDMQWCYKNLPHAYANAEEFRHISIAQLEEQYQRIVRPYTVIEQTETGENVERIEFPSLVAEKVAKEIKDMQAKLLGAYQTVAVNDNDETVTYTVTVGKRVDTSLATGQPQAALEGSSVPGSSFDRPVFDEGSGEV